MNARRRAHWNAFAATAFTLGSAVAVAQTTGPAAAAPPKYAPDVPAKITK